MFRARIALIAVCMSVLNACTNDADEGSLEEHANYFVPEDASEVVTAPDIPWVQKSFNVSRESSEFAIPADKLARTKSDGWRLCQPPGPEWMGFQDATLTPPRYTQQRAYVLYKDSVLVVLVGKYYSDAENTAAPSAKMDQHGMVIVRNATDQEAQETADSFKLSCD